MLRGILTNLVFGAALVATEVGMLWLGSLLKALLGL